MNRFANLRNRAAAVVVGLMASGLAAAEGTTEIDFSAITSSIDMATIVTGVLGVAGLVMVLTLATKGASVISSTVKKA